MLLNSKNSVSQKKVSFLKTSISVCLLFLLAMCLLTGVVAAEKSMNEIVLNLSIVNGGYITDNNILPLFTISDAYVSNLSTDNNHYLYITQNGVNYIASVENISRLFSDNIRGYTINSESCWNFAGSSQVVFDSSGKLQYQLLDGHSLPEYLMTASIWKYSYNRNLDFWLKIDYLVSSVTFDANGGTFSGELSNYTNLYSPTGLIQFSFASSPIPTRDGYSFAGWTLRGEDNVIVNEPFYEPPMEYHGHFLPERWGLNITCDSYNDPSGKFAIVNGKWLVYENNTAGTLYAKWVENSGTGTSTPGNTGSSAAILIGTKKHTTDSVRVEPHSVTFHANGGVGDMAAQQFMGEESQKLTLNTFTRDGYNFIGWGLAPEKSVTYTDGQEITLTEDLTLYAIWTEIPLDISSGQVLSDDANGEKLPAWAFAIGGILIIVLIAGTVIYFAVRKKQQ